MVEPEFKIDASLRERWRRDDRGWALELPPGWSQGRTVFGGLSVAAMSALGARHVDADRRLRLCSTQLLRPVVAGEVRGDVSVLREGKGTAVVEVRLIQAAELVALCQLVFVTPREGSLEVAAAAAPPPADVEGLVDLPYLAGVVPEFTQRVQMRWAKGSPPFTGGTERRFEGYCRFREPAGGAEGVLAMLDVWPSPTLGLLSKPAFASTVSWTAHLIRAPERLEGWCQFEYETAVGREGFHTAVGRLYDQDGALLGWTEQLVALFD